MQACHCARAVAYLTECNFNLLIKLQIIFECA